MAVHGGDPCGEDVDGGAMNEKTRFEIFLRHGKGESMNSIAKALGLWPFSVRYQIRREYYRGRDRRLRREDGAAEYTCAGCGLRGHNVVACPDKADPDENP